LVLINKKTKAISGQVAALKKQKEFDFEAGEREDSGRSVHTVEEEEATTSL
jgi:hypothetical protein